MVCDEVLPLKKQYFQKPSRRMSVKQMDSGEPLVEKASDGRLFNNFTFNFNLINQQISGDLVHVTLVSTNLQEYQGTQPQTEKCVLYMMKTLFLCKYIP